LTDFYQLPVCAIFTVWNRFRL